RLAGAHHASRSAGVESEHESIDWCCLTECRRDAEILAVRLFQRDKRALRLDELHETLQRVAEQQLRLGGGQQPARELHDEGAEASLPLQRGTAADHDGEARSKLDCGFQLRSEEHTSELQSR